MNMPYQQPMMNYTPNYGTYQYNPMASYQRYQQPEPTQGISGRVVQAVETINPNEVPMDGSVAFFPKQDLTEIYAKSWNADGTIRTLTFKPALNGKTDILSSDTEKLDMYIRELSGDISELLNDMTPDERNLLRTKMSNLASKL